MSSNNNVGSMLPPQQCDDTTSSSSNVIAGSSDVAASGGTTINANRDRAASTMCKIPNGDGTEDNNNCYELDVINSKDPYAELERYLEKVKAEISEVFAQLESRREENGSGNDTVAQTAGGSCDGQWSASVAAAAANASTVSPPSAVVTRSTTIPRKSTSGSSSNGAAAAVVVRDSNYNTKASRCQNVACDDELDGANLEATERLLREIAATLPKQNHHSQQQQQQHQQQQQSVSSHQQYSHNHHHHHHRNNGAFESARYCCDPTAFVIGGGDDLQHQHQQQQLVLKIDEDHDKPEHQQRTPRFNGRYGATDNSQSSDYENSRDMHDSLSDDMSLLEELSMYGGDSAEQDLDMDNSDSKDSSSPKLSSTTTATSSSSTIVQPRYHKNQLSTSGPRQYHHHQQDKQLKTSTNSLPSTSRIPP